MLSRYLKRPEEKKKKKMRRRRGEEEDEEKKMSTKAARHNPACWGWGEASGKRHAENVAHGIECESRLDGDGIDVPSGNALELGIKNITQGKDSL